MLTLTAASLVVVGIRWGLPQAVNPETVAPWGYDELAPLAPLTEAYYGFTRSGTKYLAYPLFHYVLLCIAYSPYIAIEWMTGQLHPSSTFPYGFTSPEVACARLTLIARLVSSFMAAGIVLAAYEIALTLFDRRSAFIAGVLTAVLPTLVYYGKVSTVDVPYLLWLMLATLCVAKVFVHGEKVRYYIAFGIFSALAVCTKDQAIGFLLIYPFLFAAIGWQQGKGSGVLPRLAHSIARRPLILGLVASLATFAIANNVILGWSGFARHVNSALTLATRERMFDSGAVGQTQLVGHAALLLAWTIGPAIVWGAVGAWVLALQRRWALLAFLALPPIAHHFLILGHIGYAYPRFLLPAAVFAALLGAAGLHYSASGTVRRLLRLGASLGVAYMLLLSIGIDYSLVHDARYDAERWIAENVPLRSRFEADTQFTRLLPRVWDRYALLPSSGDADLPTEDYFIHLDLSGGNARPSRQTDRCACSGAYIPCTALETPTLFPRSWVRLVNCTAPRVVIYRRLATFARRSTLADPPYSVEPARRTHLASGNQ